MDSILQQITDWLKEMLVSAIMGNLSGMFESVNNQVGEIATSVGMTPANFSPGVFAMVRNISESVIIPIAGLILTFIACYELIHKFNGQVVKISSSSTNYINPMDINLNYSEDDNPVALKADFILSLCELIMGSKDGLQPIEKTVIDRCVHQIYQRYFDNPAPENMPILEDLYDALLKQDEKEAHHVATALEIYVKGSLKLFNNRTNVDIQNRLVCFDIKELGNQLKKIGMLIVQDQVWGRVTANRSAGKSTRYYIDEFHLLLKEEQTATYSVEIWKRFRKWGGLPTGITQNVKDLLRSPEIANILENSDFIYMLNQASDDRSILAQRLNISPHQLSYVTNSGEGEGLLFYGNVILPFIDRFPTDLELYRIMTTKLNEVAQEKEA